MDQDTPELQAAMVDLLEEMQLNALHDVREELRCEQEWAKK
jgi:hypothetical protein